MPAMVHQRIVAPDAPAMARLAAEWLAGEIGLAATLRGDMRALPRRGLHAAAILAKAVGLKPTGHRLEEGVSTEDRQMFQIGG